jgi:hypothetical protein
MQGILYEEASIWQFLFITLILGGWAAWMTGRACAQTWRPYLTLVVYLLALGHGGSFHPSCAVRGNDVLVALLHRRHIILMVIGGTLGYRYTRTNQMVSQYHWLYDKVSPSQLESQVRLRSTFAPTSPVNRRDKRRKIGNVPFLRLGGHRKTSSSGSPLTKWELFYEEVTFVRRCRDRARRVQRQRVG